MTQLSPQAQEIVDVVWMNNFETVGDKRYLVADILRTLTQQLAYVDDYGDMYINAKHILDIAEELGNV